MTEKRFVDYFDKDHNYIIQDLQNEDEYQVGFVNCDEDELLNLLNALHEENEQLKQDSIDKKRVMAYLCKYTKWSFDEIVDDIFNNDYYDNYWDDGFYEEFWEDYVKEKELES